MCPRWTTPRKLTLATGSTRVPSAETRPLTVSRDGSPVATFEATASRPIGTGEPIAIAGTWTADLAALTPGGVASDAAWTNGKAATGDFSAKLGASTELDGKLAITVVQEGLVRFGAP